MKTIATALALVLMTGSLGMASPVLAQKKDKAADKPAPPKLSKPIQAVVVAVQKLQTAGDHAGAFAKLEEAMAIPRTDKDDAYTLAVLKIQSAQALKDNVKLEQGLTEAYDVSGFSVEQKLIYSLFIARFAGERKDYQKAWKWYNTYLQEKPNDADQLVQFAAVNEALGDTKRSVDLVGKAISIREASGEKAQESWYRYRLSRIYDATQRKPQAGVQPVVDKDMENALISAVLGLVSAYPTPTNFNLGIRLLKEGKSGVDNNTLIDWGRLLRAANAMVTANDYLEYAEAAIERGMPNEADMVLKEAITKKLIDPGKQNVGEIVRLAASKNTETKAALPGLEKEAGTNPRIGLVVADTLANLGQHEKAVGFYQKLVGNAAVDQDTVNLRMGAAMLKMGNKDGAKAAFAAVKAGPRAQIAQFYGVLAGA